MTITEEEPEEWEAKNRNLGDHVPVLAGFIAKLIAEVRRQREAHTMMQKEVSKRGHMIESQRLEIEEQAKEIAKLKGETTFGHGRAVAGLERFR